MKHGVNLKTSNPFIIETFSQTETVATDSQTLEYIMIIEYIIYTSNSIDPLFTLISMEPIIHLVLENIH